MNHPDVLATLIYGGMLGLLLTGLGLNVSRLRGKYKVFVGGQPPPELNRAIRAHGNAAEWVPLGLLLLLALELSGVKNLNVSHGLGGTFFLGRVIHAFGTLTTSKITVLGAFLTYISILALSVAVIAQRF